MLMTRVSLPLAAVVFLPNPCSSFVSESRSPFAITHRLNLERYSASCCLLASSSDADDLKTSTDLNCQTRRACLTSPFAVAFVATSFIGRPRHVALAADYQDLTTLDQLLSQIKQARDQLDVIPDLIEKEKWDSGKFWRYFPDLILV